MKEQNYNLRFLDGLRGLAALYVVIGHARWLLWEGYSNFQLHPQTYSWFQKVLVYFFALFRYGHESVLFFFVLSGFVIHLRYARQLKQEGADARFDWQKFIWRRAYRLYPPLLAALALSGLLAWIGDKANYTIYRATTLYPVINQSVDWNVTVSTLMGNLAFLMDTYVPVFAGNGPLWSLKFEWWFYMLYPVFWWLTKRTVVGATVLMTVLFLLAQTGKWQVLLLQDVFGAMLTWWLGVLLAEVYVGRLKILWAGVAGLALLGLAGTHFFPRLHDLGMAFAFSGLLAVAFILQKKRVSLQFLEWLKPLGDMSYTLYVTHFPMLLLASGWLMNRSPQGALPKHLGWVLFSLPLILLLTYGIHRIAERPFLNQQVR